MHFLPTHLILKGKIYLVSKNRLDVTDSFGFWFSGFFDGEGHLYVSIAQNRYKLAITIDLRDDDAHVIEMIAKELRVGNIHKKSRAGLSGNPQITFKCSKIADLHEVIVPLFDRYKLSSKKGREFKIWRDLVRIKYLVSGARCNCKYKKLFEEMFIEGWRKIGEIRRYK